MLAGLLNPTPSRDPGRIAAREVPGFLFDRAFRDSWRHGPWHGRVAVHLLLASILMLATIYAATGSLAPYSATPHPRNLLNCGYTGNTDHWHFIAVVWMLKGYPVADWEGSVVLRRILHPMLAMPFISMFGFYIGALVFNVLIHLGMLALWARMGLRHAGRRGTVITLWLLAGWPGISYWVGQPYSYAAIVPGSVLCFLCLLPLASRASTRTIFFCGLGIGVVSQAYEIAAFFGPAAVLLLAIYNRRIASLGFLVGLSVPFLTTMLALEHVFNAPGLDNSNTATYGNILGAYLSIFTGVVDYAAWLELLEPVPLDLVESLLYGTFWALPILAVVMLALTWFGRRDTALARAMTAAIHPAVAALSLSVLALFLFNNLAPPYPGWSMRGDQIARLYQPIFVALLFQIALSYRILLTGAAWKRGVALGLVVLGLGFHGVVAFGGLTANLPLSSHMYYHFYRHGPPGLYERHLDTFGRRPVGFCVGPNEQTWEPVRKGED